MLLAYVCFGLLNICMRKLHGSFDPIMISAIRSFFCVVLFLPLALIIYNARKSLKNGLSRLNFYKGIVDFLSIPAWALAISNMNIAEAVALSQTFPLFVTILAAIFLKEKLTLKKFTVIFIGMIGALIIIKPHTENFNMYSFVVLFICLLWASSNIMTKFLTNRTQNPLSIIVYTNLIIFSLSLPNAMFYFKMPDMNELQIAIAMSLLAGTGYICVAHAVSLTQVSTLAQIDAFRLIFATIFAYIFFGQVIDIYTIIGAIIIISCTTYMAVTHMNK